MANSYTIKGLGQLEKRGHNKWRIRLSLGYDPMQKKYIRSPSRTVDGTKADAIEALIEYKEEIKGGLDPKKAKTTIKDYAWNFHVSRAGEFNSPLSHDREKYQIRHIIQWFGNYYVADLDTYTIRSIYAYIRENRLMSEHSLFKMHQKLSQMMKWAVWDQIAPRNPCEPIRMIKPEGKERGSLSVADAAKLDELLFSEPITSESCAVLIALHTGIRRGEIMALSWKRIDFENNYMHILYQYTHDKKLRKTKCRKSLEGRYVSFDDELKAYLIAWKQLQAKAFDEYNARCLSEHGAYGPNGKLVQSEDTPVITNRDGGIYDPDIFSRWFRDFCVKNEFGHYAEVRETRDAKGILRYHKTGYVGLKFHELRHTQSSLLSEEGIDLVTVMHRLGHKDIKTTLGYTHRPSRDDVDASRLMGELLSGGKSRIEQLKASYPSIEIDMGGNDGEALASQ